MKPRGVATLVLIAALGIVTLCSCSGSSTSSTQMVKLEHQVSTLNGEISGMKSEINSLNTQVDTLKVAMTTSVEPFINDYQGICTTSNVQQPNGSYATEYNPCSNKNPNG